MGSETGEDKPGFFRRTWRGEARPWLSFWLVLVPSALTGLALGSTVGMIILLVTVILLPQPVLILVGLAVAAVPVLGAITTWRCSRNLESFAGRATMKCAVLLLLAGALYPGIKVAVLGASQSLQQAAALEKQYASLDDEGKLLLAAKNGDPKRVEKLLATGVSANAHEKKGQNVGRTPLHYAAGGYREAGPGRHLDVAKLLVAAGADVNARAQGGYTPLHVAAGLGNMTMVAFLAENGANLNAKDPRGTPLGAAVLQGQLEVVKFLIGHGADVNAGDEGGYRPIDRIGLIGNWYARHDDIFILLINAGADLNPGKRGGSPLAAAIQRKRPKLVLAMIEKGAVADALVVKTVGGSAQREIADALAKRGDKIFSGEGIGSTLLHGAVCNGDVAFFDWVMANTPDVNARDESGSTPLHLVAGCGNAANAAKLLDKGANAGAKDGKGLAPLDRIYGRDAEPVAALLLKAGANPNETIGGQSTPLISAAGSGNAALTRLLLQYQADVNAKNRFGRTALHEAVRLGRRETVELLLGVPGIRIDELNERGKTALHIASEQGATELVELLRAKGADPSIRAPDGKIAAELVPQRSQTR
jgi:ankyrin repeat protein